MNLPKQAILATKTTVFLYFPLFFFSVMHAENYLLWKDEVAEY